MLFGFNQKFLCSGSAHQYQELNATRSTSRNVSRRRKKNAKLTKYDLGIIALILDYIPRVQIQQCETKHVEFCETEAVEKCEARVEQQCETESLEECWEEDVEDCK